MIFKTDDISQLYTLRGSFGLLGGAPEITEDGFAANRYGYRISTKIEKHESGVYKRCDVIENVSDKPIELRSLLSKFTLNGGEYEVYTQYSEWCHESVGVWNKLISDIGVGNADTRSNTGNPPFLAVYNTQNGRGTAFHLFAKSTWQMKARKNYSQFRQAKNIEVEMGISEKGFSYTLMPGQSLELPEILYYEFTNKTDMDAYKLHRYYNAIKPARAMPLVYDTWLSDFDDISYDKLMLQLEKASELGFEYFVIDAGWFGKPRVWFNNVGDWCEEKEASMQGRMKEFADKVREYGLKFGLWFEIERASVSSSVYKEHPEYYLPENGHAFVNFADPNVVDFIYKKLADNIDLYGIEYIKFDHNATLTYDSTDHSFIEYFKGYLEFLHRINTEKPQVYLENCASGGLRMSLASADGFDSFWMSDNHSLYMQLEVFKNTLVRMPSRMLETWLTVSSFENFTPTVDGKPTEKILSSGNADWSYLESVNPDFVSAVMYGGPIGMSCNLTKLSSDVCKMLKANFDEFKAERDFWAGSECHILCDTDTMLVLQFNDIEFNHIKIFSFAKHAMQNEITVYPVTGFGSYMFDGKAVTAEQIAENGVSLSVNWMSRITANTKVLNKI